MNMRPILVGVLLFVACIGQSPALAQSVRLPIEEQELEHFARWLRLDENQQDVLTAIHETYLDRHRNALLESIQAFHTDEMMVVTRMHRPGANRGEVARREFPPLERRRLELQKEMDDLDEAFYIEIESLLDDEQLPRMQRVRLGRERLAHGRRRIDLPEGDVDLIGLLDGLGLPPDVYEAIEADFILDFESRFLELVRASQKAARDRSVAFFDIYDLEYQVESEGLHEFERMQMHEEIVRRRERASRRRVAASELLVELNRAARLRVLELLPASFAVEFDDRYWRIAYPMLFPDPGSAERLYKSALDIADLSEAQRAQIIGLQTRFFHRHQFLTEQMVESYYWRIWSNQAGRPSRIGDVGNLWALIAEQGEERESLNTSQFQLIAANLTPQQVALLPEWDFKANPRPRPWDPVYEDWRKDEERRRLAERLRDPEEFRKWREEQIDRQGNGQEDGRRPDED